MKPSMSRLVIADLAVCTVLGLSACGSNLEPGDVVGVAGTEQQPGGPAGVLGEAAADQGTGVETAVAGGPDPGVGSVGATGSTGGAGGAGGADGSGSGGSESGEGSATGGVEAGKCDGLKDQTGITSDAITIANSSDISGPVPGLFQAAQDGVAAYVAYFNATNPEGICGRKLTYMPLDSREDAGADQAQYTRACAEAFAVIGSASAFDSGGAQPAEGCGIPDLRAMALTDERGFCSVCYSTQSGTSNYATTPGFDFYRTYNAAATESAGFLYINVAGAADVSANWAKAAESRGFKVVYTAGIDIAEFNYAPYVQQLKDKGVKYVNLVAATSQVVRFAQAMEQQGYEPEIFDVTQEQYTPEYVETGGDAVDGSTIVLPHPTFDDPDKYPELKTYLTWLQQVKPGAAPTTTGVFAWSAARLFVEKATALGGDLTRETLLAAVRKERKWTGNGIHSVMDVGGKLPGLCAVVVKLDGGSWQQISKAGYTCGQLIKF